MKRNVLLVVFFVLVITISISLKRGVRGEAVDDTSIAEVVNTSELVVSNPSLAQQKFQANDDADVQQTLPEILRTATLLHEKTIEENGQVIRKSLYSSDFKYPIIQMEETYIINASGKRERSNRTMMVGDHVMVRFPKDLNSSDVKAWVESKGYSVLEKLRTTDIYLVQTSVRKIDAIRKIIADFNESFSSNGADRVVAEPNYLGQFFSAETKFPDEMDPPNREGFWWLHTNSTFEADIDAPEAWNITTGSHDVVVAVIDNGIDRYHTDLSGNIWSNPNPGSVTSPDGFVFTNDVYGWNFANTNNNTMPTINSHSHGTMVAGVLGAVGNNDTGVVGIAWNVSIVPIKLTDISLPMSEAVDAVTYAARLGVDIICASWGKDASETNAPTLLEDAIREAGESNILFVAAAGNYGTDNDDLPVYPASFDLDNIIAVAAINSTNGLAKDSERESCYGTNSVDLAAPGIDILTTTYTNANHNSYTIAGMGTSWSAPLVAGTAALMKSIAPDLHYSKLKSIILDNVDSVTNLSDKVATGGRLNTYKALRALLDEYVYQMHTLHSGQQYLLGLNFVDDLSGVYTQETFTAERLFNGVKQGDSLPDGTEVVWWNSATQSNQFETLTNGTWSPNQMELINGDGFWVKVPITDPAVETEILIDGHVDLFDHDVEIVSGNNLLANPYPVTKTIVDMSFSPTVGDAIYRWNGEVYESSTYSSAFGVEFWTSPNMKLMSGEGFWYQTTNEYTWSVTNPNGN